MMTGSKLRTGTLAMMLVALGGCQASDALVQEASRSAAKSVVNGVISQRFPRVNAAPYTDCIIDNASTQEIVSLATGAVTGADEATVSTVLDIAGRPDTSNCIARNALGSVLG